MFKRKVLLGSMVVLIGFLVGVFVAIIVVGMNHKEESQRQLDAENAIRTFWSEAIEEADRPVPPGYLDCVTKVHILWFNSTPCKGLKLNRDARFRCMHAHGMQEVFPYFIESCLEKN